MAIHILTRGQPNPPKSMIASFTVHRSFRRRRKKKKMEAAAAISGSSRRILFPKYSPNAMKSAAATEIFSTFSPLLIKSMATQKPLPSAAKTVSSRKVSSIVHHPLSYQF